MSRQDRTQAVSEVRQLPRSGWQIEQPEQIAYPNAQHFRPLETAQSLELLYWRAEPG